MTQTDGALNIEQLRDILNQGTDPLVVVDEAGHIVMFSSAASALLGYNASEIEGSSIEVLVPMSVRSTHQDLVRGFISDSDVGSRQAMSSRPEQLVAVHKDGSTVAVHITLGAVEQSSGGKLVVASLRDLTNDLYALQLEDSNHQLKQAIENLSHSNRELEMFASIASHDLQEPLRKIEAFGDRLRRSIDGELNDKAEYSLRRMQDAATRMRRLIDNLLEYSKVGSAVAGTSRIELGAIVAQVVSDVCDGHPHVNADILVNDLPAVYADEDHVYRVFLNLVGNAFKFRTGDDDVRIEFTATTLTAPNVPSSGPRVRIDVADNGEGFAQEYAGRIFDTFERVHGRDKVEGAGMGLSICRRIIQRYGGSIDATSEPGVGSVFSFDLPLADT